MRVFDPRGQTIDIDQLFADLPGYVSEIRKRRDDANLLRENQAGLQAKQM